MSNKTRQEKSTSTQPKELKKAVNTGLAGGRYQVDKNGKVQPVVTPKPEQEK